MGFVVSFFLISSSVLLSVFEVSWGYIWEVPVVYIPHAVHKAPFFSDQVPPMQ